MPDVGDVFDFLVANTLTVDPDMVVINISGLESGFEFDTSFNGGSISLVVPMPVMADGDVNGDGQVDVADLLLAMRILNGQYIPTQEEQNRWDVAPLVSGVPQSDLQNNVGDYLVLQRKVLGVINFCCKP